MKGCLEILKGQVLKFMRKQKIKGKKTTDTESKVSKPYVPPSEGGVVETITMPL